MFRGRWSNIAAAQSLVSRVSSDIQMRMECCGWKIEGYGEPYVPGGGLEDAVDFIDTRDGRHCILARMMNCLITDKV